MVFYDYLPSHLVNAHRISTTVPANHEHIFLFPTVRHGRFAPELQMTLSQSRDVVDTLRANNTASADAKKPAKVSRNGSELSFKNRELLRSRGNIPTTLGKSRVRLANLTLLCWCHLLANVRADTRENQRCRGGPSRSALGLATG